MKRTYKVTFRHVRTFTSSVLHGWPHYLFHKQ